MNAMYLVSGFADELFSLDKDLLEHFKYDLPSETTFDQELVPKLEPKSVKWKIRTKVCIFLLSEQYQVF